MTQEWNDNTKPIAKGVRVGMVSNSVEYMVFPNTVLTESECRHFSIMLPRLSVLKVLFPPALPAWFEKMAAVRPVLVDQEEIEIVRRCFKGYQEFAAIHGDHSILSSVGLEQISRDFAESRFRIQTQLKGIDLCKSDDRKRLFIEAAVFLEMAQDLDEKEVDLESSFTRIKGLEGEFRQILGLSDEEELDTIAALSTPLREEKTPHSFMLSKRIQSWLLLFSNRMPEGLPVLVTTSEEVVEELLEPLRAECEKAGKPFEMSRESLGSIPAMDDLSIEEFLCVLNNPEASGLLASFWHSLDNALVSPREPASRKELSLSAEILLDFLCQYRKDIGMSGGREIKLDLVNWIGPLQGFPDVKIDTINQIQGMVVLT
jgi:hypothetical protein